MGRTSLAGAAQGVLVGSGFSWQPNTRTDVEHLSNTYRTLVERSASVRPDALAAFCGTRASVLAPRGRVGLAEAAGVTTAARIVSMGSRAASTYLPDTSLGKSPIE